MVISLRGKLICTSSPLPFFLPPSAPGVQETDLFVTPTLRHHSYCWVGLFVNKTRESSVTLGLTLGNCHSYHCEQAFHDCRAFTSFMSTCQYNFERFYVAHLKTILRNCRVASFSVELYFGFRRSWQSRGGRVEKAIARR
jgi:hypothetical protein